MQGVGILNLFSEKYHVLWKRVAAKENEVQEIRLRAGKAVLIRMGNDEYYMSQKGEFTQSQELGRVCTEAEIYDFMNHICRYSAYAFEEELRQGYLTVPGGHRIGIAGQVVLTEEGNIRTIKHISYINIRISHQVIGAADMVMPYIYKDCRPLNCMIISPPGCGKTTLLRDIIRQLSQGTTYGKGCCVGVVDERSELGGSYLGIAQNDLGMRTDVLDGCPKALGMMMLIRSMAPMVVAVDEIGSAEDVHALLQALQCGCRMLVTLHGDSIEEIKQKPILKEIFEQKVFDRFIVLNKREGKCKIDGIYKKDGTKC